MRTVFRLLSAAIGLLALGLQYWLVAQSPDRPGLIEWTINYFSFFTILTNCLAALAMLLPVILPNTGLGRFFSSPPVRTAIAGYIIIVAAVYFLILRHTWDPQGWNKVADQLLHYVTPTLFVLDWLVFVPRGQTPWKTIAWSLVFPLTYVLWTLAHGVIANWYPYPFIDVSKLGYPTALINIAGLIVVFGVVAAILTVLDRSLTPRERLESFRFRRKHSLHS